MSNNKSYVESIGLINMLLCILYLIDPFNYGYIFSNILIISVLLKIEQFKSNIDNNFFILLLFSISYAIFYSFNLSLGSQFIFIYALYPSCFYIIGKIFYQKLPESYRIFDLLLYTGLLFSTSAMISVLVSIYTKGFVVLERDVPMIWGGDKIPATNMAAYFVLNMSIPAFLVANFKRFGFLSKILLTLIFMLSVICVLRLGSRTQLSISFITFLASLVYLLRRQSLKQNVILFGILFLLFNVFISYVSLSKDSDIMSAFAGRMESKKYGAATAGGRTERWSKSIINLWEKPLGWQVDDFGFSHNLWFDVARVGGTLTFLLLLYFCIKNAMKIKTSIFINKENILLNTQFICYGLSFYLLFFVEPIFDGYYPVFILYCFFIGIVAQHINHNNTINS